MRICILQKSTINLRISSGIRKSLVTNTEWYLDPFAHGDDRYALLELSTFSQKVRRSE
jgi:hypothetical protein